MKNWETLSDEFAKSVREYLAYIDMPQKELAERLNISEQRMSIILSGNENLSLETIVNVYIAIGVDLIEFPNFKYFLNVTNLYAIG